MFFQKKGFNNKKYISLQSKAILERVERFDKKLYIEIGGKLLDDLHASRVLPGFKPDVKIKMLKSLKDKLEVIFCISAKHVEQKKVRGDYGITYADEGLRIIGELRKRGITVSAIVITLYKSGELIDNFIKKLKDMGEKVYIHTFTKGYPDDVKTIVSDEGYGANPYVPTTRPIVIVNGPGPCSGKLATCLSQMYHEYKMGIKAGYAKYESFPIWNLPLNHPINLAYEAATADIKDYNMIDTFHEKAYGISAVNYNRDMETFPVLRDILYKITGEEIYKSPTDMGVNKIGYAITNDKVVREASKREIIRRYEKAKAQVAEGKETQETLDRIAEIVDELE